MESPDQEQANRLADRPNLSGKVLAELGDAALDPVIAADGSGRILYWNKRSTECFGWEREEAVGRRVHDLVIPARHTSHHLASFRKSIANTNPKPNRYVTQALRKDGSEFAVELSIIHVQLGSLRLPVCFARDLSAAMEAEQRLREAESRLLHLSRSNAMAAMASALAHELAQPIGAARNYLSAAIIQNEGVGREALHDCQRSLGEAAVSLSKIRGLIGNSPMFPERLNLHDLARDVLVIAAGEIDPALSVQVGHCAVNVWADRIQVEQIMLNLLRNAVEACRSRDQAQIEVAFELNGGEVVISVSDNGSGIPAERITTLFEAFRSTKSDAMGIGLAIARVSVEGCGGRIWLGKTSATGTTVCFTLPAMHV